MTSIDVRPPLTARATFRIGLPSPVVSIAKSRRRRKDFVVCLQRFVSPAGGKEVVQRHCHILGLQHRLSCPERPGVVACIVDDFQNIDVQLLQKKLRGANEHKHRPSLLPRAQAHRAAGAYCLLLKRKQIIQTQVLGGVRGLQLDAGQRCLPPSTLPLGPPPSRRGDRSRSVQRPTYQDLPAVGACQARMPLCQPLLAVLACSSRPEPCQLLEPAPCLPSLQGQQLQSHVGAPH